METRHCFYFNLKHSICSANFAIYSISNIRTWHLQNLKPDTYANDTLRANMNAHNICLHTVHWIFRNIYTINMQAKTGQAYIMMIQKNYLVSSFLLEIRIKHINEMWVSCRRRAPAFDMMPGEMRWKHKKKSCMCEKNFENLMKITSCARKNIGIYCFYQLYVIQWGLYLEGIRITVANWIRWWEIYLTLHIDFVNILKRFS